MRLIDADAIKFEYGGLARIPYYDYQGIAKYFAEQIKQMSTVEPEHQWTPCSKGLPKTNGIYNVTRSVSDGFECRNITDACYFDGSNTWHDDTRINHERKYLTDVVAWCELPEPYREEGEK